MNTTMEKPAVRHYDILVEKTDKERYTARLLAWPDCVAEAATREEALCYIRTLILERLAKAEIVTLAITPEEVAHPWLPFAGDWAGDPTFDEFQAEIERNRRAVDAIWSPWFLEAEEDATAPKELELA